MTATLRERNAAAVAKDRAAQRVAAFEFLTTGESEGPSPDGEPWDRTYDPLPYPEALPSELRAYDGTGVGALYGQTTEASSVFFDDEGRGLVVHRSLVVDLAGWNVGRRS